MGASAVVLLPEIDPSTVTGDGRHYFRASAGFDGVLLLYSGGFDAALPGGATASALELATPIGFGRPKSAHE